MPGQSNINSVAAGFLRVASFSLSFPQSITVPDKKWRRVSCSGEQLGSQTTEVACIRLESPLKSEVVMKNPVYWHVTPCSPLKVNRRFGGSRSLL
jgi:hypothetical protein